MKLKLDYNNKGNKYLLLKYYLFLSSLLKIYIPEDIIMDNPKKVQASGKSLKT